MMTPILHFLRISPTSPRRVSRRTERLIPGLMAGILAVTVIPAITASSSSASNKSLPADSAANYTEVMQAALYTAGEARIGYAAESMIRDMDRDAKGDPRLEVSLRVALHDLTTPTPQMAVERKVWAYGEAVDSGPYRTETWGGVGTGAYGSAGTTQAWIAIPEDLSPASAELVEQVGNPARLVSRAMAATDLSPNNRPHSVIEARLWNEHNVANPWGPLLDLSTNVMIKISKVTKITRPDGVRVYTITWAPGYPGSLMSTSYVTEDGLLALTHVRAVFPPSWGDRGSVVEQESRMTWIGGQAPMPGPSLTTEVRRASSFARRAAAHAVPAITAHASTALRLHARQEGVALSRKNLISLAESLAAQRPRWAAMSEEKAGRELNQWVNRYRIVPLSGSKELILTVEASALQHSAVCEVSLTVINEALDSATEPSCRLVPLPVLGVDTLQPEDIAIHGVPESALSPNPSRPLGAATLSPFPFGEGREGRGATASSPLLGLTQQGRTVMSP